MHEYNGIPIRVAGTLIKPLFYTEDLLRALKLMDATRAELQAGDFIDEHGLYALMFTSQKQEIRDFRAWVIFTLLPSIRRAAAQEACAAHHALEQEWTVTQRAHKILNRTMFTRRTKAALAALETNMKQEYKRRRNRSPDFFTLRDFEEFGDAMLRDAFPAANK